VLAASGAYLAAALTLPLGSVARPGPGFFPVAVGVFLCVVAAVLVSAPLRGRAVTPAPPVNAGDRGRVATTLGGLIGFCLLLPWTGIPRARSCSSCCSCVASRAPAGPGRSSPRP